MKNKLFRGGILVAVFLLIAAILITVFPTKVSASQTVWNSDAKTFSSDATLTRTVTDKGDGSFDVTLGINGGNVTRTRRPIHIIFAVDETKETAENMGGVYGNNVEEGNLNDPNLPSMYRNLTADSIPTNGAQAVLTLGLKVAKLFYSNEEYNAVSGDKITIIQSTATSSGPTLTVDANNLASGYNNFRSEWLTRIFSRVNVNDGVTPCSYRRMLKYISDKISESGISSSNTFLFIIGTEKKSPTFDLLLSSDDVPASIKKVYFIKSGSSGSIDLQQLFSNAGYSSSRFIKDTISGTRITMSGVSKYVDVYATDRYGEINQSVKSFYNNDIKYNRITEVFDSNIIDTSSLLSSFTASNPAFVSSKTLSDAGANTQLSVNLASGAKASESDSFTITYNVKLKNSLKGQTADKYSVGDAYLYYNPINSGSTGAQEVAVFPESYIQQYYNIKYENESGGQLFADEKMHGNDITLRPASDAPSKSGYTFSGWQVKGASIKYSAGTKYSVNNHVTLVPDYTKDANMYTVRYVTPDEIKTDVQACQTLPDTSASYAERSQIYLKNGATLYRNYVQQKYLTFKHWVDDNNNIYQPGTWHTVTENVTFYPVFEETYVKLTFDVSPGYFTETAKYINKGATFNSDTNPTKMTYTVRAGKTYKNLYSDELRNPIYNEYVNDFSNGTIAFEGWLDKNNNASDVISSSNTKVISSDTVFYANWGKETHLVRFAFGERGVEHVYNFELGGLDWEQQYYEEHPDETFNLDDYYDGYDEIEFDFLDGGYRVAEGKEMFFDTFGGGPGFLYPTKQGYEFLGYSTNPDAVEPEKQWCWSYRDYFDMYLPDVYDFYHIYNYDAPFEVTGIEIQDKVTKAYTRYYCDSTDYNNDTGTNHEKYLLSREEFDAKVIECENNNTITQIYMDGWNSEILKPSWIPYYLMGDGDVTLYPIFRKTVNITVTDFDAGLNDYTPVTTVLNEAYYNNDTYYEFTLPEHAAVSDDRTASGLEFVGWRVGDELKQPGDKIQLTEDISITAEYKIKAKMTYDLNGSTVRGLSSLDDDEITLNIIPGPSKEENIYSFENNDNSFSTPVQIPRKTGYMFINWVTNEGETRWSSEAIVLDKDNIRDLTVSAEFEALEYGLFIENTDYSTVSWPDGENPDSFTIETPTFTLLNPVRTGYTFTGWQKLDSETDEEIGDVSLNVQIEQGTHTDLVFSAVWTPVDYTISYNLDGGTVSQANPETYNAGQSPFVLNNPVKTGYDFTGWTETEISEPQAEMVVATDSARNLSFTANYSVHKHSITYKINGEVYKTVENVEYGSNITPVEYTASAGHTFGGWQNIPATMPDSDIVIDGTVTVNKNSITYTVDGEVYRVIDNVEFGSDITPIEEPEKTGWTFGGWQNVPDTMPDSPVTISGEFTRNKYKINYILDGETYGEPDEFEFEENVTLKDAPDKTGYTFGGWTLSPQINDGDPMPASDITATGSYSVNKYHVNYVVDGEPYGEAVEVEYNAPVTIPAPLSKEGHTFSGWDATPSLNDGKMPASDVTVSGTFTVNSYTLSFTNTGDSVISPITQEYGTPVTPPQDPVWTGHTFIGWPDFPDTMPAQDLLFIAKWNINQYTITFDTDGGTPIDPITQDYDTDITAPDAPVKTGHTFTGWDVSVPAKMPTNDITLTAQWSVNKYKITVDSNGGEPVAPVIFDYDSEITAPQPPERTGYEFAGWDKELPNRMPDHDIELVAQWTPITYYVVYNPNGADETPVTVSVEYDKEHNIRDCDFSNKNSIFTGWNTKSDGTGTEYKSGNPVKNLANTAGEKVNLYAMWVTLEKTSSLADGTCKPGSLINYSIVYSSTELNNNVIIKDTIPEGVTVNEDSINPEAYSVSDGVIEWRIDSAAANTPLTFTFSVTVNDNIPSGTVISNKARADVADMIAESNTQEDTVNYLTVKYVNDDDEVKGEVPVDKNCYSKNDTATVLDNNNLSKAGYKFAGWNTRSDGSGIHCNPGDKITVGADTVFYPQWFKGVKTAEKAGETLKPGDIINYTITVEATDVETDFVIEDVVPEYTEFVDSADGTYSAETNTVTWTIENAEKNTPYELTFSVRIKDDTPSNTSITNSALVKYNYTSFVVGSNPETNEPNIVDADKYIKVIYNGDNADNPDAAPVDKTNYSPDDIVEVASDGELKKANNKFAGWNTEKDGSGKHYEPLDDISAQNDITLYSQWFSGIKTANKTGDTLKPGDIIKYTITFTLTEGNQKVKVSDKIPGNTVYVAESASENGSYNEETDSVEWIIDSSEPDKEYSFEFSVRIKDDAESNAVISNLAVAKIGEIEKEFYIGSDPENDTPCITDTDTYYKVKYDIGNAEGTAPSDKNNYSENASVTAADDSSFSNGNYIFTGWNDKKGGTGNHYNAGDTFNIGENKTLYAMWVSFSKQSEIKSGILSPGSEIEYTITYQNPELTENLVIADVLSDTLAVKADSISEGGSETNGVLSWTFANVPAGEIIKVSFIATVKNSLADGTEIKSGDVISNKASATADRHSFETNSVDDTIGFYTVKYVLGKDESGDVPVDNNFYKKDDSAVISNRGNLKNGNKFFAGWKDESGKIYREGEKIAVSKNVVFRAVWGDAVKTADITSNVKPGDTITYTVKVTIPDGIEKVTVTDVLPDALTLVSAAEYDYAKASVDGNKVIWTVTKSADVTDYALTLKAKVSDKANGGAKISNKAEVDFGNGYKYETQAAVSSLAYTIEYADGDNSPVDNNRYAYNDNAKVLPSNNEYVFIEWNTKPDGTGDSYKPGETIKVTGNTTLYPMRGMLKKELVSLPERVVPGSEISYKITVSTPYAKSFNVTDIVPDALNVKDVTCGADGFNYSIDNNIVSCTIPSPVANEKYEIIITVTVRNTASRSVTVANTAKIRIEDAVFESPAASFNTYDWRTVTYNTNGAKGTAPVDNTYYSAGDKTRTLSGESLTMDGAKFIGWNTKADGTGRLYRAGHALKVDDDVELYAIFEVEDTYVPYTGSSDIPVFICLFSLLISCLFIIFIKRKNKIFEK